MAPDDEQIRLQQAREILEAVDFPFSSLPHAWAIRTPKVMLSLAGMTPDSEWTDARGWGDTGAPLMGSRALLTEVNNTWDESISRGSYDEIRRGCVKFLVEAGIAIKNPGGPARAPNNPSPS